MRGGWIIIFLIVWNSATAQELKTRNLIIVTLDGFRWQELFRGADSLLLFKGDDTLDKRFISNFWCQNPEQRRALLMPFFWNVIGRQGQVLGNRFYDNHFNCSNPYWFSYPGYSEMLVGFVALSVKSNRKVMNPNSTVLEFIHQHADFTDKVAAFTTWNAFSFILRSVQSGVNINPRTAAMQDKIVKMAATWNHDTSIILDHPGRQKDNLTFCYAFEYLKERRPRVLLLSLDETDEHAHKGHYNEYLEAARRTDCMLQHLWAWVQQQNDYRDQTTLIITTDHGRGSGPRNWRSHGRFTFKSGQIWMAVIGPDTPPAGELKTSARHFQKQVASTAAAFLGLQYTQARPVGEVIRSVFYNQSLASILKKSAAGK